MPRYKDNDRAQRLSVLQEGQFLDKNDAPMLQPQQVLSMAEVSSSLGELLINDEFRQDIKYKYHFDNPANDTDVLEAIFSGTVYRDLRDRGVIQQDDLP